MQTYAFTVRTNSDPNPAIVDAIYGVCDDASATSENDGRLAITFDREAESLEKAIRSAVDALRTVAVDVSGVTLDVDCLGVLNYPQGEH